MDQNNKWSKEDDVRAAHIIEQIQHKINENRENRENHENELFTTLIEYIKLLQSHKSTSLDDGLSEIVKMIHKRLAEFRSEEDN